MQGDKYTGFNCWLMSLSGLAETHMVQIGDSVMTFSREPKNDVHFH